MTQFKAKLIYCDQKNIDLQKDFLNELLPTMNELRVSFKEFDFGDICLNDLCDPLNLDAIALLKSKATSELKGAQIKGLKLNPEKVFDLIDIDHSNFVSKVNEFKDIANSIHQADSSRRRPTFYDTRFFEQEPEGTFKINEEYLLKWSEKHCKIYTANEEENLLLEKVTRLADVLNELRPNLKHPQILAESDDIYRLLFYDRQYGQLGTFKANRNLFRK